MSAEPSQPPEGMPITFPEFLHLLETKPEFAEKMRGQLEAALATPLSPETEPIHAHARNILQTLKHYEGLSQSVQRLGEAQGILERAATEWDETTPKRLNALIDESLDHLLDVREPERTVLMKQAMEMQNMTRRLLEKE